MLAVAGHRATMCHADGRTPLSSPGHSGAAGVQLTPMRDREQGAAPQQWDRVRRRRRRRKAQARHSAVCRRSGGFPWQPELRALTIPK